MSTWRWRYLFALLPQALGVSVILYAISSPADDRLRLDPLWTLVASLLALVVVAVVTGRARSITPFAVGVAGWLLMGAALLVWVFSSSSDRNEGATIVLLALLFGAEYLTVATVLFAAMLGVAALLRHAKSRAVAADG